MAKKEKKGIFSKLCNNCKEQECCCNIQFEEIPEEEKSSSQEHPPKPKDKEDCCGPAKSE